MAKGTTRLATVSCSNHHETLTGRLWDFLTTRHRVDLDLQWGGRSIGAHQLIVEVFLPPEKLGLCALDDQDSMLYFFLEFLYKGTVTVQEEQLDHLLQIAKEMDFQMLAEAVESTRKGTCPISDTDRTIRNCCKSTSRKGNPAKRSSSDIAKSVKKCNSDWLKPPSKKVKLRLPEHRVSARVKDNSISTAEEEDVEVTNEASDVFTRLDECDGLAGDICPTVISRDGAPSKIRPPRRAKEMANTMVDCQKQDFGEESDIVDDDDESGGGGGDDGHVSQLSKLQRRKLWLQRQPILKCDQCDYQNRCKTRFREHKARHDPSVAAFTCDSCRRPFLCQETFGRHRCKQRSAVSLTNKPVDEATTLARLERRKVWLQSQPILRCELCNYENRCKTRFQEHMSRHDPSVAAFTCDTCGRPFLCKETFERHRCKLKPKEEPPETYACPHCSYKARKKRWFQVHLAKHDPTVNVYRCDTCSKPFFSNETLERHRLRHTVFRCPHCPSYETTKSWCYSHHLFSAHQLNTKGETVRKIQCPDCEFSCQKESELKYHAIAKHSGDKPFKCELCNFASGYKSDVPKHVKVAHLNIKPHMCEQCGYRTATAFKLEQHKQSHTEIRPYTCDICGQTYKDQGSFKRHVRRHVSDDKPYVCHMCGHPFNRRQNLKVHLKNVHKTILDPEAFKARMLMQL